MLSAVAAPTGRWRIDLAPHVRAKGEGSFRLTLRGDSGGPPAVASNVAYGDVLLCSGQSNMAISLTVSYNATAIIAAANRPEIRLFTVAKIGSRTPLKALLNTTAGQGNPAWRASTPASSRATTPMGLAWVRSRVDGRGREA